MQVVEEPDSGFASEWHLFSSIVCTPKQKGIKHIIKMSTSMDGMCLEYRTLS